MRAFIFSLDAFVAFTLALIAIYSLIFFSSVPSAYYYMLTQAHYLARDTLMAASTSACIAGGCGNADASVLNNIAFQTGSRKELIRGTIGLMVPSQFGYSVSVRDSAGQPWVVLYNTSVDDSDNEHAKTSKKLTVSTQVMVFSYTGAVNKLVSSPYAYGDKCSAGAEGTTEEGIKGSESAYAGTLITCGTKKMSNGDGTYTDVPLGNVRPSEVLGVRDVVPESEAKIVKLTIFI
ncbi:hypothetical protein H0O00_02115 [Candidatus Micrarchaeota archaeon]|nr:hypothetical protein [Candidatus Micrarchaeota archaeon]